MPLSRPPPIYRPAQAVSQQARAANNADEHNNPESGKASEADKSALAAINRALRMAGLFRERAYMARLRAIPFKYVHESRRGRWRAWRRQASPLHIRHDQSVQRDGRARLWPA